MSSYTEAWLVGPKDTNFYTRTYAPPEGTTLKAALVFIHGFAEHIDRYRHFHPRLAEHGIAVFTFDQRGFGLTAQDKEGRKSKDSAYGKTCWNDQMGDINWALTHTRKQFESVPLFLMGHSMGGGETLGFSSLASSHPTYAATLNSLSGVVVTSPLIHMTKPASKLLVWTASKLSFLAPNFLLAAPVQADALSHDDSVAAAYIADPLVKQAGGLRQIADMITQGQLLLTTHYQGWPKNLPLLLVHGDADNVTCCKASQSFVEKIGAEIKKLSLFPEGFHELQNEPKEVADKLFNEIASFIDERLTNNPFQAKL